MSIADRYEPGEHQSNVAHFAAIVKLATVDGPLNPEEIEVLKKMAFKLNISKEETKSILRNPDKYPLIPPYSMEEREDRFKDFCRIVSADHELDAKELKLIYKYAIGLGFSNGIAKEEIKKCSGTLGSEL